MGVVKLLTLIFQHVNVTNSIENNTGIFTAPQRRLTKCEVNTHANYLYINNTLCFIQPSSLALGDKAVLGIIVLASATVVTIILTAIIYTVWCKNNSVHPDVESIEVKEAPVTSRPHREATTTSRAPPPPPATKAAQKSKAPAPREPEASPAKKGPAKKGKMLKKDAW